MLTIQPDQLVFLPIPFLSLVCWTAGQYIAMLSLEDQIPIFTMLSVPLLSLGSLDNSYHLLI